MEVFRVTTVQEVSCLGISRDGAGLSYDKFSLCQLVSHLMDEQISFDFKVQ